LSAKDEKIANFCCQQILSSLQNTAEDISILDVGSGEGSLLTSISQKLSVLTERNINMEIALDCVEPSPEGQEMIIAALGTIKNPRFRYSLFRETIEEFLDRNILPYSIVLCIHSLYFIRRDSWADIISKLLASKNGDVRVVVDVVSRKSDIYQIFDSLCSICDMDRLQRTFDSCGQLYFAEDLEPLLDKLPAHSVMRQPISAPITFKSETVARSRRLLHNGLGSRSEIVQFLAFMFRLLPAELARAGRDVLIELLERQKGDLTFISYDILYSLHGTAHE
jgi:predicted CopG family antitoxin